jgi:hypothetical protein
LASTLSDSEVKFWRGRVGVANACLAQRQKQFKENVNRYANRNLPKPTDGMVKDDYVRVNMLFSNIKTKMPTLMFRNPEVLAIPMHPEVDPMKKLLAEATIRRYLKEWDFKRRMRSVVLDSLLGGIGIIKPGYSIRTVPNTDAVSRKEHEERQGLIGKFKGKLPKGKKVDVERETFTDTEPPQIADEGPIMHRVSPQTFLTHPDAKFPLDEGARWVGHIQMPSLLELRYDDRFPMDWRRKVKSSAILDVSRYPHLPRDFDPTTTKDPDMQFVGIYEIWDRLTRKIYWFAEDNWELGAAKVADWPFRGMEGFPFEFLFFSEIPDEFGALSEYDPICNQLEELDKMRTFQLRHMKKVSNRIAIKTSNFHEGTDDLLRRGADGTILTTDAERADGQLVVLQDMALSRDFYAAEETVKEDLGNVSGVAEFDRARVAGAQSATEASIIETANRIRSEDAAGIVSDFAIRAITKGFQIMQQWLPAKTSS